MLGSFVSAHSTAMERSSGLSLLQAVHSSFSLARFDCNCDVLLPSDESSNGRISRIVTSGAPMSTTLSLAQQALSEVVQRGSAVPSLAANASRLLAIRLPTLVTELLLDLHDVRANVARVEAKEDATLQEVAATRKEVAAMRTELAELSANVESHAEATSTKLAELEATTNANAAATRTEMAAQSAQRKDDLAATRAEVAATRTELAALSAEFAATAAAIRVEAASTRTVFAELSAKIGAILALHAAGGNGSPRHDGG